MLISSEMNLEYQFLLLKMQPHYRLSQHRRIVPHDICLVDEVAGDWLVAHGFDAVAVGFHEDRARLAILYEQLETGGRGVDHDVVEDRPWDVGGNSLYMV